MSLDNYDVVEAYHDQPPLAWLLLHDRVWGCACWHESAVMMVDWTMPPPRRGTGHFDL